MTVASALGGLVADEVIAAPDGADWSELGAVPEAVVSPSNEDEVAAVLAWASREDVGVVPVGSGRHLGVHRMSAPFIVLTSKGLCGLEIYEPADVTFTARAGTRGSDLATELATHRQWLPFDPPELVERTLGGLVSSGVSGPLATGYGAIRNHVLGATSVTGDGRVLRLGGRVVKNVAGFDLLKLVVGGRGRVGFLTSICMRAFPTPAAELVLWLQADSAGALVAPARSLGTAPVQPVSCVLEAGAGAGAGAGGLAPTGCNAPSDDDRHPVGIARGARLIVRLHGAEATVEADRRTLEAHVGTTFLEGPPDPPSPAAASSTRATLDSTRAAVDSTRAPVGPARATDSGRADVVLIASFLPSRLSEVVASLAPLPAIGASIDTCAGRLRLALSGPSGDAMRAFSAGIQGLGGAVSIERAPAEVDVAGVASRPSEAERDLTDRLRAVFDPEGVLWRSAR